MRSKQPKVLHPVCGRPILAHAVATSRELGATRIVCVVGNGEAQVREALAGEPVEFVVQSERLGTAHAVLQAREFLADHQGAVLVMYGDHPLFRAASFSELIDAYREQSADLAMLVAEYPDRSDFGRIVRGPDGKLERIVEHHDASPEIRALREVNLGVYLIQSELLLRLLARIGNDNDKGEYYLTELVPLVLEDAGNVITSTIADWDESLGVNSRVDLARAESVMRQRIAERWMLHGVTIEDPGHTYIDADVEIGSDTVLAPGVCLRGTTRLGSGCRIDAGAVVENSTLGDGVWLKPHCHVEESELGNGCIAGPSAHFRPNSKLAEDVRVGNFVEVKNSNLGRGTKADHLSYIGDADVGERVTFACGAITVNYDGREKHRTTVGDGAFVGCNANLIAPITIEARAYVAAGSTITQEVPSKALAVGRARQRNIDGWWDRKFGDDEQE